MIGMIRKIESFSKEEGIGISCNSALLLNHNLHTWLKKKWLSFFRIYSYNENNIRSFEESKMKKYLSLKLCL
jgi:hypothetical protein